jgi:putative ABC transport system ATP-binding protein
MIVLKDVERYYEQGPSRTYVLRRINLEIKDGEFLTVMGPSGAGKSTLLAILGMLDASWNGEYYFLDQPVHKLGRKERA